MPFPLRLVSLLVVGCVGALVPVSPAAADDHSLQRGLDELVAAPDGPPGVIVVLRDGDRQRVLRAGTADLTTGRPLEPDDHTRTASTSKAFSGAVALSLVRQHRLGLDDTIGARLPQLPKAWRAVTLRQLLQRTSGLPDFSQSAEFRSLVQADVRRTRATTSTRGACSSSWRASRCGSRPARGTSTPTPTTSPWL